LHHLHDRNQGQGTCRHDNGSLGAKQQERGNAASQEEDARWEERPHDQGSVRLIGREEYGQQECLFKGLCYKTACNFGQARHALKGLGAECATPLAVVPVAG